MRKKFMDTEECSKKLEKNLQQFTSSVADVLVEESYTPNQVIPKQTQKERLQQQLDQEFSVFTKRIKDGVKQIMQSMVKLELVSAATIQDLNRLLELSQNFVVDNTKLVAQLKQEKSLQEIVKISDCTLDKLYMAAKHLYDQKQYTQSANAFYLLTILNPKRYSFWLGLANSEYFTHNFQLALIAYANCCQVNPNDPICHIFSSRCYEELKEGKLAINALDLALFVINDKPQYAHLSQQITQEKQRLIKKFNK